MENISRLFNEDIRDKKKTGSGSFHKTGKGVKHGFNGALRTPYYYMTVKEKKKLNGEVACYSMDDLILTKAEFEKKDLETQKRLLQHWRSLYPNTKIMNEMGIKANNSFSRLLSSLGIEKKARGGHTRKRTMEVSTVQEKENNVVTLLTNGLRFEYNGIYDAEQMIKMLAKVQLLLDSEPNKFEVHFTIAERA
jgi:hypothetical protein